jgi:hypothetical protein
MKKIFLYLLVLFVTFSCNIKKEKTSEELLLDKKTEYTSTLNTNSNFELGDSSSLLSIKLLSTEREYRNEVRQLVANKKLKYLNRKLIYDMGDIYSAPAYCEVIPKFHNGKLYKLVLNLEFYDTSAGIILGDLARTAGLYDMMKNIYGGNNFYIYDKEYSDLMVSWINNGKEVLVRNGSICYTALKEEKSMESESSLKTLEVIKGL